MTVGQCRRLCFASLLLSTAAMAGTVVVTAPGYGTNSGSQINDLLTPDTWLRENFRAVTSMGTSATNPRSGSGSMEFRGTSGTSKGDVEFYFSSPFQLGDLTQYAYDWYRSSASMNSAIQVPSFRLVVSAAGTPFTADGYLIYEPYYQTNANAATDEWVTSRIDGSSKLWWSQFGKGIDTTYNRTLDQWRSGSYTAGFKPLSNDSLVIGISLGVGSGWYGDYSMFVDNVSYQLRSGQANTFNFEPVPEPASLGLLVGGGALLAWWRRRSK